jgi:hypothetical protein
MGEGRGEYTQIFGWRKNLKERENLEDLSLDG